MELDFPCLADEIAEPRPDMNIKVTAFTESIKLYYTFFGGLRNVLKVRVVVLVDLQIVGEPKWPIVQKRIFLHPKGIQLNFCISIV